MYTAKNSSSSFYEDFNFYGSMLETFEVQVIKARIFHAVNSKFTLTTQPATYCQKTELIRWFDVQIKSQATGGFQAFIIHYREDPDQQNLIDWIQEDWVCIVIYIGLYRVAAEKTENPLIIFPNKIIKNLKKFVNFYVFVKVIFV